eukprot:39293_1
MYLFKYYHACICYDQLIHSHHAQHHSITLCSINDISVGAHVPVSRPSTAITSPLKHIIQRSDMIQSKEVSIVCLYCVLCHYIIRSSAWFMRYVERALFSSGHINISSLHQIMFNTMHASVSV